MKSSEEIKKWLLENCVDSNGDLTLSFLDFSDFDGDIFFSHIKTKNCLYQCYQQVGKHLGQGNNKVGGTLYQDMQNVDGQIFQGNQVAGQSIIQNSQTTEDMIFQQNLRAKHGVIEGDIKE